MKLAHSAPTPDRAPQSYAEHVRGAVTRAGQAAADLSFYMRDRDAAERFRRAVLDAAIFHDLGKLDPENQEALRRGRSASLPWDHIDGGVAHLQNEGARSAAWLVRGHHAPGLPSQPAHFAPHKAGALKLRGCRNDDRPFDEHQAQVTRTDVILGDVLAAHCEELSEHQPLRGRTEHGLFLRLALSCLVDGDHGDSAFYETGLSRPEPPAPRWEERLAQLDAYVRSLDKTGARQADRDAFYQACREGSVEHAMAACEGPVGIGKTTAVVAWLLRRAMATNARRIIIVAPFTTILSQNAGRLRQALVLPDEVDRADEVIAEHHHRADFAALASRDLAVLWQAPIVMTTGVQFFETLAACEPAQIRKLHALPGSVVCLDEAHAALPAPLWKQNWAWMQELTADWGCSFVFASGSLARVWEQEDVVGSKGTCELHDLVPRELQSKLIEREYERVRYRTLGRLDRPDQIINAILGTPGPRLVVLNTVQSAAAVASRLLEYGDTLHLSTALCPEDRNRILAEVSRRLNNETGYSDDWTLVATSLVEAGVDLSFKTALRERFSASSLIQIGGRVNRHGHNGLGEVVDFFFDRGAFDTGRVLTHHPGATGSATVLARLFARECFDQPFDPAQIVTAALLDEVRDTRGSVGDALFRAESNRDYPATAARGRVIATDTRLVVVQAELRDRLQAKERVSSRDLLSGSVQLWSEKIDSFGLQTIGNRPDVYWWSHGYDENFLGYMDGGLRFAAGGAFSL